MIANGSLHLRVDHEKIRLPRGTSPVDPWVSLAQMSLLVDQEVWLLHKLQVDTF